MRTLHIFGDSFAAAKGHLWGRSEEHDKYHSLEELFNGNFSRIWDKKNPLDFKEHLAAMFDVDILSDSPWTCVQGTSDEYLSIIMSNVRKYIKDDDYVVYISTDPTREFFIENAPNHGNPVNFYIEAFRNAILSRVEMSHRPKVEKQIKTAVDYMEHIQSQKMKLESLAITYHAKMLWINRVLGSVKNKIIIPGMVHLDSDKVTLKTGFAVTDRPFWDEYLLPGMTKVSYMHNDDLKIKGCIGIPSFLELKDPDQYNVLMNHQKCWQGLDKRRNHLSKNNHKILAEKIYDSIVNRTNLDLTKGFESGFLTPANCNNVEYTIDEVNLN